MNLKISLILFPNERWTGEAHAMPSHTNLSSSIFLVTHTRKVKRIYIFGKIPFLTSNSSKYVYTFESIQNKFLILEYFSILFLISSKFIFYP